ncbi:MAG: carboxypeptidase M32 [Clostridia bacterium]|nr:carboxypeptidase M32 [Clostridia bacterium]
MTLEQAIAKLNEFQTAATAYGHAMGVMYVDGDTAAPALSYKGRGNTMAYLSGITYKLVVNDETAEICQTILDNRDKVTDVQARQAELLKEEYEDMTRIPMDEFVAYQQIQTEAAAIWHEAKEKSDYAMFAPYLEKLIDYNRRFASYKDSSKPAYDVMLDGYEKGASTATLDPFFATLREKLTPVILAVADKPAPRTDFLEKSFPVHIQREFSSRLMAIMGMDPQRCTIAETEHPFTSGFNKWDVRITTHYHENNVASSMYSVIHEGGHALYELGTADDIQFTSLATGATMGLHESQSRFYENLIGRSLPFCRVVLPVMQELFPRQMEGVTAEMLYAAVNKAQPSLIRTEADELTYAMHIMIRYEMEKLMFNGDAKVSELPALWNKMYKDYLGVTVPDDRRGILQDTHWSGGMFGYFPSYALGSAYGVQMLSNMEKDVDVWGAVGKGDLTPVTAWLGDKLHRYGKLLTPDKLLLNAMGEPFNPVCYTDYLTKKFSELYKL